MIKNDNGFFCLTPAEFAAQCEAAGLVPRLTAVGEAQEGAGLRAWPSGLLPWCEKTENIHVLAWPDGKCMVSLELWKALGGA
jgi:hypothetical protein